MDKLLINHSDFDLYKDISENLDRERLNTYILDSQFIDIRGFLGPRLYKVLQDGYDAVGDKFEDVHLQALWFGTAYNDVEYYGLKPALIQYAYARLLEGIQLNITRAGVRKFSAEESEEVEQSQIYDKSNAAKSMALAYLADSKTFLDTQYRLYPQWIRDPESTKTSMTFFKV